MDRRTWLTATAMGTLSAFSGCLSELADQNSSSGNGSAASEWPEIAVETEVREREEVESEFADVVGFEGWVKQQPTDETPPQITLEMRNDGNEQYEGEIPYPYPWRGYGGTHTNDDATIQLIPDDTEKLSADPDEDQSDEWIPEAPTDGCWTAKTEARPVWPDVGYPTIELQPGEQQTGTFTVLSSPTNEKCLPRGTYEFSDERLTTDYPVDAELELTLRISVSDPE